MYLFSNTCILFEYLDGLFHVQYHKLLRSRGSMFLFFLVVLFVDMVINFGRNAQIPTSTAKFTSKCRAITGWKATLNHCISLDGIVLHDAMHGYNLMI